MNRIFAILITLALSACGGGGGNSANTIPHVNVKMFGDINSLLWNPGPNWFAGSHVSASNYGSCDIASISDLSEAGETGTANVAKPRVCQNTWINPQNQAPSFFHVTYGWDASTFNTSPGWNAAVLSGGHGLPMTLFYANDSSSLTGDPCDLKEVGLSYVGERDLTDWPGWVNVNNGLPVMDSTPPTVFRGKYDPTRLSAIHGKFLARLDSASAGSGCIDLTKGGPDQRIEVDMSWQHFDNAGHILRTDILGISIFNTYNPSGSDVLFSSCDQYACERILDGSKLGYSILNSDWQVFDMDLLTPMVKYMPAKPTGTAYSVLIGYEIYSTGRSMKANFDLTQVDLIGT